MLRTTKFTVHLLAASAAGLLGIGLIGQVAAQDDDPDAPAAAQQNAAEPAPDEAAPAQQAGNTASDDATPPQPAADDAPPSDDLQFNDESRGASDEPPAIPRENEQPDDRPAAAAQGENQPKNVEQSDVDVDIRQDNVRREVRRDDIRDEAVDGRVSPSDRIVDRDDGRGEVRRMEYDDSPQPIPEGQVYHSYGHGCHPCGNPCARRVYYNPCGGCGHWGRGWNSGYSCGPMQYQTQRQEPNRPVIGMTIRNDQDGVQVVSVVPNSPAAEAGLRDGDRIVAIDGMKIRDAQGVMNHLRGMDAGGQISLTVERGSDEQELTSQIDTYAKVFGDNRGRIAQAPAPP